ncbi:hypothetical protein RUM44_004869 [Polyplax serrata]|uniref:Uncharacterized protein n=1 Tax=Polyplax serrata TaxID=468196 RepID=A0ABR1B4I8_POLSC
MKEKIIKEDEWDAKERIKGKVSRLKRRTRTERKNAKVKDADGKFLSVEEDYDKLKDKIIVNHGFNSLKENLSFLSLSDLRGNELSGAAILEKSLMPPSTALSERNGFSGVKLCLIRWPSMLLEITLFV